MSSPVFTVFTPTYNRAHLIRRVYESLERQTFRDFEWLIVDDGSTDGTRQVVESFSRTAQFPVRYIWQENGHKKAAFNRGVREARGELFLPWDSDDEATPNALEQFHRHWTAIPNDQRRGFVGVCGLCVDDSGHLVGDRFPHDVWDSDALECRYRYHIKGEKWGFSRTDVLREHPFPENVVGHVPEGIVWSSMARRFKTRFINEVVRIYRTEPDSLTQAGAKRQSIERIAEGHVVWAQVVLENELAWFLHDPLWFLKMATNYTRFSRHLANRELRERYRIQKLPALLLVFMMLPIGVLCYARDRSKKA